MMFVHFFIFFLYQYLPLLSLLISPNPHSFMTQLILSFPNRAALSFPYFPWCWKGKPLTLPIAHAPDAGIPVINAPIATFALWILNGYAHFLFLKVLISSLPSLSNAPFLQPRLVTWRPYPISHLDEWIKCVNIAMPSCGLRYEYKSNVSCSIWYIKYYLLIWYLTILHSLSFPPLSLGIFGEVIQGEP
jgi:hypothetical protein